MKESGPVNESRKVNADATADATGSVAIDDSTEERLAAAVSKWGEPEVVQRAVALVGGFNLGEEFLLVVGGRHAQGILGGAPPLYWPELWGTRALLYVWDDSAASGATAALSNRAWRVREMATRVAATRALPVTDALTELLGDEVARVRASAARALGAVGDASAGEALRLLLKDPEIDVRRGAQQGIDALRLRHPLGDAPG